MLVVNGARPTEDVQAHSPGTRCSSLPPQRRTLRVMGLALGCSSSAVAGRVLRPLGCVSVSRHRSSGISSGRARSSRASLTQRRHRRARCGACFGVRISTAILAGSFTFTGSFKVISETSTIDGYQRVAVAMGLIGIAGGWLLERVAESLTGWLCSRLPGADEA